MNSPHSTRQQPQILLREAIASIAVGLAHCFCGCQATPFTGRQQLRFIPQDLEFSMGEQSYAQVLSESPSSVNARWISVVERVGQRLASVSGRPDFRWEFRLLASQKQNAFCLPGGKVAVYEGILPVCQNEAGLSVVMSHEIAHAIARHGAERMSQQTTVQGAGAILGMALQNTTQMTRDLAMQVYGTGSQVGLLLPYNRKHESEADEIGMTLMARAGYDPNEAPRFWSRFSQISQSQAQATPEWLSTHPADWRRASELAAKLPQATQIYQANPNPFGLGESIV